MKKAYKDISSVYYNIVDKSASFLIKCRYSYNKVYRIFVITLLGLMIIGISITIFAVLYKMLILDMSFPKLLYNSASIYISGNERDLAEFEDIQYLIIIEQFVSFIINNIFLATITYNLFKTYNNVFLSKNLYILEQEGSSQCYVLRFRIGDLNNEFANYRYSMQFFKWYENIFKDPYYIIQNDIPELDYVYNEDNCIYCRDKTKVTDLVMNTNTNDIKKNAAAVAKVIFAEDNVFYAHNSICITITAISTKTSEKIIIRRYYGKKNILFVSSCKDVFKWDASKKQNKTTPLWHHIDKYEIMDENRKGVIMSILHKILVKNDKNHR